MDEIKLYNNQNNEKVKAIYLNAKKIDFSHVNQEYLSSLCGPTSIFPALKSMNKITENQNFADFVQIIHSYGDFNSLYNGMSAEQMQDVFDSYSLKSTYNKYYDSTDAIAKISEQLDQNKLVYLIVNSNISYSALTQTNPEFSIYANHWVQVVALNKNNSGKVDKFAIYDINYFLKYHTINYIHYDDFLKVVSPTLYENGSMFLGERYGAFISVSKT